MDASLGESRVVVLLPRRLIPVGPGIAIIPPEIPLTITTRLTEDFRDDIGLI